MENLEELNTNLNQKVWEKKLVEHLGLDPKYAEVVEEAYECFSRERERETGIPWKSFYVAHLSRLIVNLSPNSYLNQDDESTDTNSKISPLLAKLRKSRLDGNNPTPESYDPNLLPYLTNYELNTNSDEIRQEIELRKNQEVQIKYSEDYTCSKCKERKTKEYRLQARSGDEGYTYKAECVNCGFSWRLN